MDSNNTYYPTQQYPDSPFGVNDAYNFGIGVDCDPSSQYMRTYDEETKYIRQSDCIGSCGCIKPPPAEQTQRQFVQSNEHFTQPEYVNYQKGGNSNFSDTNIKFLIIGFLIAVILLEICKTDHSYPMYPPFQYPVYPRQPL